MPNVYFWNAKINQAGMPHYSFGTGTLVRFLADAEVALRKFGRTES
jgi:hypothetical protein